MALAERAQLVAELRLDDKLSAGLTKAGRGLSKFDGIAKRTGQGLRNLSANLLKVGAVAAVGIGAAVKSGLDSLAELESATTSVQGAIDQMGLAGKITAGEVATWANEIEASIGAAFDDKAIVQATTTLIRFGKITPDNLRPAMQIITDLATKTGDVDSAASLLAKALADPEKAAGKLARQGIVLTKVQEDQIKAFVKAGKAADAQRVILDALTKTTKGAALASQGPYRRALSVLADVSEDAKKALAEGFLPVLEKVAGKLSTALADPKTIASIRDFGQTLAGSLDSLLSIAERLPWGTIADSMRIAGAGAKTLLNAFTSLPPWVQTAVITGWGLNKLTGGALGGIVGELGKGLIKGVLGMNAGVVNITAGTVTGVGGIPGAVAGGGKAGSGLGKVIGTIGKVFLVGMAAGVAFELAQVFAQQSTEIKEQGTDLLAATKANSPKMSAQEIRDALANIDQKLRDPLQMFALSVTQPFNDGLKNLLTVQGELNAELARIEGGKRPATGTTKPTTGPTYTAVTPPGAKAQISPIALAGGLAGVPASRTGILAQPGAAGVFQRAIARGFDPSAKDIAATLAKDARILADRAKAQASVVRASADRTIAALARVERAIASKDFSPNVNVQVTTSAQISLRETAAQSVVNSAYQTGKRTTYNTGAR